MAILKTEAATGVEVNMSKYKFFSRTSQSTILLTTSHHHPSSCHLFGPSVFEVSLRGESKRVGRCGRGWMTNLRCRHGA